MREYPLSAFTMSKDNTYTAWAEDLKITRAPKMIRVVNRSRTMTFTLADVTPAEYILRYARLDLTIRIHR